MRRKISIFLIFSLTIIALPLVGVRLTGRSAVDYASFPPLTRFVQHASFSWPVFAGYATVEAGLLLFFLLLAARPRFEAEMDERRGGFRWWGWAAVACMVVSWVLAWTRFGWFAPWQRFTFIPLWLSFIGVANALCLRQTGSCPMVDRPLSFVALFPASAAFWWYFEYLNQFAHNWYYTGVDYGPAAYSLNATVSFCTVLPAVATTRELIARSRWFRRRFHGLPPLPRPLATALVALMLPVGFAGLIGVGILPERMFSMLWVAPLLLLTALQHIAGERTFFSSIAEGDWRPAISAALAALACGFFWEMWNFYSLAKWMYAIPYVDRFKVFEMPVLGYMGYLPFGLECIALVDFLGWGTAGAGCGGSKR